MPIVQSFGQLQAMAAPAPWTMPGSTSSIDLYGLRQTYGALYAAQPNVRTCVDFLSRNIAMLDTPHMFRRLSDTDRERITGHDLARWLDEPNPSTTAYRLIEGLVADLGIYFNAYWLKVRDQLDGRERIGLVRVPPHEMTVEGALLATGYTWTRNGHQRPFALSEVVYFNGYNPLNPIMGLSPLETLRRILAEEAAAGEHREGYWRNASRHEGIIERPAAAPKWTATQKSDWREQWQQRFAGGGNAGRVPVLEDGMTFKATSFSPRDSEYLAARKLTAEECARAFHIPLPLVGILEHATFSNIKEQHKHLYQDCLGPWLRMIEQEIARQLLTECTDQTDVYIEFNIAGKLAGSFEEQSTSLQAAIGKPWMSVNEGRGRMNLPAHPDPVNDEIAAQQGGPAAMAPRPPDPGSTARDIAPALQAARRRHVSRLARLPIGDRAGAFAADVARWNSELEADLLPLVQDAATARHMAIVANAETLTHLHSEAINDW